MLRLASCLACVIFLALPAEALAQDGDVQAIYEPGPLSGGGGNPATWTIGCAVNASTSPGDTVSVMGSLSWSAGGQGGGMSYSDSAEGSLNSRFTADIPQSIEPVDVFCEIQVTFASFNQIINRNSSASIRGRTPEDIRKFGNDFWTYTAPGNYLLQRTWQVMDWTGPWTYANFPVTETHDIEENSCGITGIATGSGFTQPDGTFPDRYGNHDGSSTIGACALPEYQSCRVRTRQSIWVAGYGPFTHGVLFTCFAVEIDR